MDSNEYVQLTFMHPDRKIMVYCGPPSLKLSNFCTHRRVAGDDTGHKLIYFHKTRVSISLTARAIKKQGDSSILMPAYNCGSEVSPFIKNGVSVQLYRIKRDLTIDIEDIKSRISPKTKAVYVVHYFGFPHDLCELKILCRDYGLWLIEDCALALYSLLPDGRPVGADGDIVFYNYPKMLPVPDGGAMVIHNPHIDVTVHMLKRPPLKNIIRAMLPFIKRGVLRTLSDSSLFPPAWKYLKKEQQEAGSKITPYPDMPQSYYYDNRLDNMAMSGITRYLLPRFDYGEICKVRRRNYQLYLDQLGNIDGITVAYPYLSEGVCPLRFPVIVNRRCEICRRMNDLSIDAIAWWSGYHQGFSWAGYPEACFLKDHLLALPVHQQLTEKHIKYIVDELKHAELA